ncbi:hypothetical protein BD408DRAFT_426777 [Parasitella parasitica]|nr:hypothetical protein BD408DRAFT_426777 [Parasitella parasitica]
MSTNNTAPAQNQQQEVKLPPIQLPPPPIVHFYIAPPSVPPSYPQALPFTPSSSKANMKENSRRLSHSAVEKKRREKMNDKIERLKILIPSCKAQFPTSVQQPIHKLSVLQAAIDYIHELHNLLETNLPQDDPILKNLSVVTMKRTK